MKTRERLSSSLESTPAFENAEQVKKEMNALFQIKQESNKLFPNVSEMAATTYDQLFRSIANSCKR